MSGVSNWAQFDSGQAHICVTLFIPRYIDPQETHTASFFERHFCWQDDWEKTQRNGRSRVAFSILTSPSTFELSSLQAPQLQQNGLQSHDSFPVTYASTLDRAPSSFAIDRKGTDLHLVILARPSRAVANHAGSRTLEIVIGRRVPEKHRSKGSANSTKANRPDDPMPRAHLLNLNPASFLRESERKINRLETQATPKPRQKEHSQPLRQDESKIFQASIAAVKLSTIDSTLADSAALRSSPLASSSEGSHPRGMGQTTVGRAISTAVVGGNHTPGRRGEKLRARSAISARDLPTSLTSARQKSLKVSRDAKGQQQARLTPRVRKSLTSLQTGTRDMNGGAGSPGVPASPSPESPDSATFATSEEANLPDVGEPSVQHTRNLAAKGQRAASDTVNAIKSAAEIRNRGLIKKLCQYQLFGRGLTREDENYDRCFSAAYNGTVVAMRRHGLCEDSFDRSKAAQFVACHLTMYLPTPCQAVMAMMNGATAVACDSAATSMKQIDGKKPSLLATYPAVQESRPHSEAFSGSEA